MRILDIDGVLYQNFLYTFSIGYFKENQLEITTTYSTSKKLLFMWKIISICTLGRIPKQRNGRDYAYLCAVMFNGEMYDVDC